MALYINNTYKYQADNQVVQYVNGLRFPKSATIKKTDLSPDDLGKYKLPSGFFVARIGKSYRPMPQMRTTTTVLTSSPRFKVAYPYIFKSGDVVKVIKPYTTLTVSGTGATSVTLNGLTVDATPTGAANATEAAVILADLYNDSRLGQYLEFIPSAATLLVFAKDGKTLYTVTFTGLTGTGTLAFNSTAIGTVLSVDSATDEVLLVANATVALPAGVTVGVMVDEVYGIHIGSVSFKDHEPYRDIPICDEAKLKLARMPFWDDYVRTFLPMLEARIKW